MAWLERQEPCIDWQFKTLDARRIVSDETLESHEPTFAKKQKRLWSAPLNESFSVLNLGCMTLQFIDPHVNENSVEKFSETRSEEARTPLSDTRSDNESRDAASIVGLNSGHQGLSPNDTREVARINPPSLCLLQWRLTSCR